MLLLLLLLLMVMVMTMFHKEIHEQSRREFGIVEFVERNKQRGGGVERLGVEWEDVTE